jgi:hypothetical protein
VMDGDDTVTGGNVPIVMEGCPHERGAMISWL